MATDGSSRAQDSAAWSAWFSGGQPVSVVAVDAPGMSRDAVTTGALESAKHYLAKAGAPARPHARRGSPTEEILAQAHEDSADLVVLVSRDESKLDFPGPPGVARSLLAAGGFDMLLVRNSPPPRSVVAAVDGSPHSVAAAGLALQVARAAGAPLHLVHVGPEPRKTLPVVAIDGVSVTARCLTGSPGQAIVLFGREQMAGLIVLGSRGLGGIPGWGIGRVSEFVGEKADSSVLLVRTVGSPKGPAKGLTPRRTPVGQGATAPSSALAPSVRAPQAQKPAIDAQSLGKRFGKFEALKGLNLQVRQGEIYGLVGPNGAGKTTAIRIMAGLLRPTSGQVHILGHNPQDRTLRPHIGYMPQETALYPDLTVHENLDHFGRLFGLRRKARHERIAELLDFVGLAGRSNSLLADLSGGMKHRASLAAALVPKPRLLFLDEPTVGVDPELRVAFWERFATMRKEGTTILLTTHYLDEARHCSRVGFLHEGRLAAQGTPEEILRGTRTTNLEDAFLAIVRQPHASGVKP